jgi:tetratricopeptide (TPR) repeat protein
MSVVAIEEKIVIPTYLEPAPEPMPMFAENRVHQRTSGRPYPNRVVLKTKQAAPVEREYTMIRLENEFLRIEILPELGGRIFSAKDKTTGYDFFYKQSVIKPALIGALGSWVSGGVEFNWPYHHRPSTFMPVDYEIERESDGAVTVWLSEHDPIERMKGMVGIRLCPNESILETRVRVTNRTPVSRSFLWWENAAVPVNNDYQIFFPSDVSYVNFHYHRSVTTWPKASGVYNGIRLGEDIDIQQHANTKSPTSYFSAASKYDFFGGYDHGKECGVVHVANHHVSPGKKLFTWAYNQLSDTWERALTDTDGEYAELMAGSYTDNQPDFAWLEPYETKKFSQFWYPISKIGAPLFANTDCALSLGTSETGSFLSIQTTRTFPNAKVTLSSKGIVVLETTVNLATAKALQIPIQGEIDRDNLSIVITAESGRAIACYRTAPKTAEEIPEPWVDLPNPEHFSTAQELHLAGVHVEQYRSPKSFPDRYWEASLQRDPNYAPALIDLGILKYKQGKFSEARDLLEKACTVLTRHNAHPRSGEVYYILGLILRAQGEIDAAYDVFYKAVWNEAMCSRAMTQLAAIDCVRGDFHTMREHAEAALCHAGDNPLATALAILAEIKTGNQANAEKRIDQALQKDPLHLLVRYLRARIRQTPIADFVGSLKSSPSQVCLDLAYDLQSAGLAVEAIELLEHLPIGSDPLVHYTLGMLYHAQGNGAAASEAVARGEQTSEFQAFPFRLEEMAVLEGVIRNYPESTPRAHDYLGCLLYDKNRYGEAAGLWDKSIRLDPQYGPVYRNLAVAYFSHLGRKDEVLPLLTKALSLSPGNDQLVYEIGYVMSKLNVAPRERLEFFKKNCVPANGIRDDIVLEWARAYNQAADPAGAVALLDNHHFVPCEGGEHAVVEQYMFAHHQLGRMEIGRGNYAAALTHFEKAQILPDNLEAGLWHEGLLVPHQFHQADCLIHMGEREKALEIYRHILSLSIDYFANMHLPELVVYQARSLQAIGQHARAEHMLRSVLTRWNKTLLEKDGGYFGTTPFFISYIDQPEQARIAYFKYLTATAKRALGDALGAKADLEQSQANDPSKLHAWIDLQELS